MEGIIRKPQDGAYTMTGSLNVAPGDHAAGRDRAALRLADRWRINAHPPDTRRQVCDSYSALPGTEPCVAFGALRFEVMRPPGEPPSQMRQRTSRYYA